MKITLLFPPPGNLSQPYTSLPALTAFLRRAGHDVVQRDLAVEMAAAMLQRDHLAQVAARLAERLTELERGPKLAPLEAAEAELLRRVTLSAEYVADQIGAARDVLTSPTEFYEFERFRWAANLVGAAFELLSAAFWPTQFSFNHGFTNYVMPGYGWSLADLEAAAGDERQNLFLAHFRAVVPSILADAPELVGISATYPGQIIPALTLARLLKAQRPELHICLGGAVLAGLQDALSANPGIFRWLDSIVICEGEHALAGLARALSGEQRLDEAPNLRYLDRGCVMSTHRYVEDVNALPAPDYAGLPLDLYLTPEITALLPTERGCYWGRCTFCTISTGMRDATHPRRAYRPRRIDLVIEDMKAIHRQLRTRCFFLSTDAISPARMQALARGIREQGLGFQWQTEARLERGLTRAACDTLAAGGCRHLRMGLESASRPVLDAMDKGLQVEDAQRIIQDCAAAGISVHTCLILGFPGETRAQARETLRFVEQNRPAISSTTYAQFSLYTGSPVFSDPQKYGVADMELPPDGWLNTNVPAYRTARGMSPDEVRDEMYPEGLRTLSRSFPFSLPLHGCAMAVAHPLHFYTQWAYLPYLRHYGVTHYRDLPPAAQPAARLDPADALSLKPVLSRRVLRREGAGVDRANGLRDECSEPLLHLFDPTQALSLTLEPEAANLLDRCNGALTVREIAAAYAGAPAGNGGGNAGAASQVARYHRALQLCLMLLHERVLTAAPAPIAEGIAP